MEQHQRYQQARQAMDEKRYAEAALLFQENVRCDPHFKDLELLGECLMKLGRFHEAVVPLAAATTLNKGVRAPALLAEVYFLLDKRHDARDMAELALSRDPKNRAALEVRRRLVEWD